MTGLQALPPGAGKRAREGLEEASFALNRRRLGERAEALAARYLEDKGYRVVARNYRLRRAEIDLVVASSTHLVFVEVKWRRQARFGTAVEAVDGRKQRRIALAALHFWATHPQYHRLTVRFDVIALDGARDQGVQITWIPNAFPIPDGVF